MIGTDQIAQYLRACAAEVFTTMLGMEIEAEPARLEQSDPAVKDGVLAFVGIVGEWAGTGVISCTAGFSRQICTAFLLTEPSSVDDDVLDAVAEVANMIIGNFKTMIEGHLGPLGLSIPTVIYGRNYTSRSIGRVDWVVVPFRCNGERLEIRACLAPSQQGKPVPPDGSALMIPTEKIVEYVSSCTTTVFSTMLGLGIEPAPARVDREAPASSGGILAFVGMAGQRAGTGVISCTAAFARQICSAMLLTEAPSVNEDVLDAIGELTNMIIGNFKNMAEEHLGPLGLSIPTVIYGRNFVSRGAVHNSWIVVPFLCGEERLEIRVCLTPSRVLEAPHSESSHPSIALA
jgi:chemotaxis protein CheX